MTFHNPAAPDTPSPRSISEQTRAPSLLLPLFKLPLVLYRLRLGWVVGHRFMQLTHVGRRSGKIRKTVLAVLCFDRQTKEIMAVSAWNASEWYKNIQAAPALKVETGLTHYAPDQRDLSSEEIAHLFVVFRQEHPIFSRMVCRIPGWKWDSSYEEFLILAQTLNGVAFRPKDKG